eukprot:325180-Prymnesium_polylepis.1
MLSLCRGSYAPLTRGARPACAVPWVCDGPLCGAVTVCVRGAREGLPGEGFTACNRRSFVFDSAVTH